MSTRKISELSELLAENLSDDDLLAIVDVSASATKYIKRSGLTYGANTEGGMLSNTYISNPTIESGSASDVTIESGSLSNSYVYESTIESGNASNVTIESGSLNNSYVYNATIESGSASNVTIESGSLGNSYVYEATIESGNASNVTVDSSTISNSNVYTSTLVSPTLTDVPVAPTASIGTSTTQVATTAFVNAEIANDAPTKSGSGATGTWNIAITGNAGTATTLENPRTLTIGSSGKAFDGSANVTWTTTEIGVANAYHTHEIANVTGLQSALNSKASITYVDDELAALVDSSPGTLDTLNELAAALGDDPNFATTVTNQIATKLDANATAVNSELLDSLDSTSFVRTDANSTISNYTLSFGTTNRQMIDLLDASYGLGIQANTAYLRTAKRFSIHHDGTHDNAENTPGVGGSTMFTVEPSSIKYYSNNIFHSDYHPNADVLTNPRTFTIGSSGKAFDGSANVTWTLAELGAGEVANPLSQFAATTSAQLANVISDETGSGALVFSTSPTLVSPSLGTPVVLVGTNITGTAANLTAGTATAADGIKNANTTVTVSGAIAPSAGQVLTATNSTTATWQDAGGDGGGLFKGNNGEVGSAPGDIFRINTKSLTANTTIDADENASCTGPLSVDSNVTLTIASGAVLAIL